MRLLSRNLGRSANTGFAISGARGVPLQRPPVLVQRASDGRSHGGAVYGGVK